MFSAKQCVHRDAKDFAHQVVERIIDQCPCHEKTGEPLVPVPHVLDDAADVHGIRAENRRCKRVGDVRHHALLRFAAALGNDNRRFPDARGTAVGGELTYHAFRCTHGPMRLNVSPALVGYRHRVQRDLRDFHC